MNSVRLSLPQPYEFSEIPNYSLIKLDVFHNLQLEDLGDREGRGGGYPLGGLIVLILIRRKAILMLNLYCFNKSSKSKKKD